MRIGVFVGSFDPIHIGHIKVMDFLKEKNYVDKIIIMPTINYWDKQNLTDINIRFEMIKKIKRDYIIYDNENNKYQYTYEILEKLQEIYQRDTLYLIISADNIINFDKWMNYQEILEKYKLIVLNRDNIDIKKYTEKLPSKDNIIVVQDFPYIEINSTKLRQEIDKKYLDEDVYNYIIENNIYR